MSETQQVQAGSRNDERLIEWARNEGDWCVTREGDTWVWVRYSIIGSDLRHETPVDPARPDTPTLDDTLRRYLHDQRDEYGEEEWEDDEH